MRQTLVSMLILPLIDCRRQKNWPPKIESLLKFSEPETMASGGKRCN